MARQSRKWNPGDAANAFVRVILSDAGQLLGGLSEEEWQRTLAYFDGRCAYTGAVLVEGEFDRDHAVPMNRKHCGIHVFGNVLPTTRAVNREKGSKHYREYMDAGPMLEKVEAFVAEAGYEERIAVFGDLQHYCEAQYRSVDALCRVNKGYLGSLMPEDARSATEAPPRGLSAVAATQADGDTLPLTLVPSPASVFKEALLKTKHAWIVVTYQDGRREARMWYAKRISASSNIVGNLRSRPEFRSGAWQRAGIASVTVSIERPTSQS